MIKQSSLSWQRFDAPRRYFRRLRVLPPLPLPMLLQQLRIFLRLGTAIYPRRLIPNGRRRVGGPLRLFALAHFQGIDFYSTQPDLAAVAHDGHADEFGNCSGLKVAAHGWDVADYAQ